MTTNALVTEIRDLTALDATFKGDAVPLFGGPLIADSVNCEISVSTESFTYVASISSQRHAWTLTPGYIYIYICKGGSYYYRRKPVNRKPRPNSSGIND